MELLDIWAVIKKRLWILATLLLVAVGSAYSLTRWYLPKVYESTTLLMVTPSPQPGQDYLSTLVTAQQMVATYAELATNQSVIQSAIAALPWHIGTIEATSNVVATPSTDTNLLTIQGKGSSPLRASQFTQAVAQSLLLHANQLAGARTVRVVNNAVPVDKPEAPKKTKDLTIAAVLAIFVGGTWILTAEYLDDTITDERTARRILHQPILATIPRYTIKPKSGESRLASTDDTAEVHPIVPSTRRMPSS